MNKAFTPPPDMSSPPKNPENMTVDEVRQGQTGHGVRYVLIFSLSAALLALMAVWILVI